MNVWETVAEEHRRGVACVVVTIVQVRGSVPGMLGGKVVVTADGLAAGKGVVVAASEAEAEAAIGDFMEAGSLGESGRSVVIEECLVGEEVSVFALCDGVEAISLGSAQDFQRFKAVVEHPLTKLILTGLLWAFLHHFCIGIRILLLDMHIGIELDAARSSAKAVMGISLLLTVILGFRLW